MRSTSSSIKSPPPADSVRRRLLWVPVAAAVIVTAAYFRLYPVIRYPVYEARNQAQLIVYTRLRREIQEKIDRSASSSVSAEERRSALDRIFKNTLTEDHLRVQQAVNGLAKQLLEVRRAREAPRLMAADPYYYFALTRDLLRHGRMAEKIRGLEYFNPLMLAPHGHWYPLDWHPHVGRAVHHLINLLPGTWSLEETVSLVPLILTAVIGLVFLWFAVARLGIGLAGSGTAAVYLVLCPIFLKRTFYGFYDTDAYNLLFPLLILGGLLAACDGRASLRRSVAFLAAATLTTALYAVFWRGWLLVHGLLSAAAVVTLILHPWARWNALSVRRFAGLVAAFAVLPFAWIGLFWGPGVLAGIGQTSVGVVKNFWAPAFRIWPDVFLIVGELKSLDFFEMTDFLGGWIFFCLAAAGFGLRLRFFPPSTGAGRLDTGIMAVLFVLCAIMAKNAERLALFLAVPTAAGLGLFVHAADRGLDHAARTTRWPHWTRPAAIIALCAALLGLSFREAHKISYFQHPIYNATWDNAMRTLRERTPTDGIVTTWWSPGHFITAMAGRRVTFDGATQNTPQAYWVANLFLEPSETKALAILRMLNASGNDAVDLLTRSGRPVSEAVNILHAILPLDRAGARERLREAGVEEADKLLRLTHNPRPAPAYLLIYNDMVEKAMGLEYVGYWDFEKAENFRRFAREHPEKVKKGALKRASRENVRLLWSLSAGPLLQDEESYERGRDGDMVWFSNGVRLNPGNKDVRVTSEEFGDGTPQSLFYLENGVWREKKFPGADRIYSVLLLEDTDDEGRITYRTVLADGRLIRSLLFRLYYLGGKGLDYLKPVFKEESLQTRTRIYIYEVDWEKFLN